MTWNAETNIRGPVGPMGPPGEVPEAPIDGLIYGRKDAGWEEVTEGSGGGASVTISDTPPVSPTSGNLWWESDTGILYIYYDDGSSAQWVAISGGGGGGSPPGSLAPLMDGAASPGVALPYSREDHRHPSDTSKASVIYVDTADALKADKTYVDTQDALKADITYVDDAISGMENWLFATNFAGVDPTGATDSTAGIAAAIAATPAGGTLVFPTGIYLISGSGAAIFSIGVQINVLGMGGSSGDHTGTCFLIAAGVPTTRDIFHITGTLNAVLRGYSFKNFSIHAASGAVCAYGFHFDSTAGTTTGFAEVVIENVMMTVAVSAGGQSVYFNNGGGINTNGGTFNATVRNCFLGGGVTSLQAGDTLRILDNIITGPNPGVSMHQVSGAGQLIITGNNITSGGGAIIVGQAIAPIIAFNQIEGSATTEANNASVDIIGPAENPKIIANQIQVLAGTTVPLRIAAANGAYVEGNRLSSGVTNLLITAAATNTSVGQGNLFLGAAARLSDSGVGTVDPLGEWKTYTSTFAATTGTANVAARCKVIGKTVQVNIRVTLTSAVTGTFTVTLPSNCKSDAIISGKEIAMLGTGAAGFATIGTNALYVLNSDGNQYLGSGNVIVLTGSYEAA